MTGAANNIHTGEAQRTVSIVLPACDFDLSCYLNDAGFRPAAEPADETNRDFAHWRWRGATATYCRDAASGLETVIFLGWFDEALLAGIPRMSLAEAAALIASSDTREALAGLQAARIMARAELAAPVIGRLADPDAVLAEHAAEAFAAIAPAALEATGIGVGGALFAVPGWRREKLQILRRLGGEGGVPNDIVTDGLARALADEDWEIAVTAMLAAAKLGVAVPPSLLASMRLPQGRSDGVTPREHHLLLAVRAAALERLGDAANPRIPEAVRRALSGDLAALDAPDAAFLTALTIPLAADLPAPPDAYPIEPDGVGHVLPDGGRVCWVPPVRYWTGDAAVGPAPRETRLAQGFFIDAELRGNATLAGARAAAERLQRRYRCPVTLPAPHQHEVAARGTDPRRFPWGMNGARSAWVDLSPFGVAGLLQGRGEWLDAPLAEGLAPTAGGSKAPACAQCRRVDPGATRGYRFVYPTE